MAYLLDGKRVIVQSGVKNNKVITTTRPVTTEENPVSAPASIFTAERENEAETGELWNRLPKILDKP